MISVMVIYDVSVLGAPTSTFLAPPESSKLRLRGLKKSTQPSTLAMADSVKGAKHKHTMKAHFRMTKANQTRDERALAS